MFVQFIETAVSSKRFLWWMWAEPELLTDSLKLAKLLSKKKSWHFSQVGVFDIKSKCCQKKLSNWFCDARCCNSVSFYAGNRQTSIYLQFIKSIIFYLEKFSKWRNFSTCEFLTWLDLFSIILQFINPGKLHVFNSFFSSWLAQSW